MKTHFLRDDTLYFFSPGQLIVKEEPAEINSIGIAFTPGLLSFHDHASLANLPLLRNPHDAHALTEADIAFTEDMFAKIALENNRAGSATAGWSCKWPHPGAAAGRPGCVLHC